MRILLLSLIILSTSATLLHANIHFKNGKFRTDNSSQTDIKLDPDNDGTAEAIIDAGGNLGLGTLTPSANLDVAGDVFVSGELIVGGNVLNSDGSLQDGLVGWWSFDALDSSSNVIDHTGQGNTGTPTNGPIHSNGKFGKAYEFDGTNDSIMYNNVIHNQNTNFTISTWVNLSANPSGSNAIIFNNGDPSSNGYGLLVGDGTSVMHVLLGGVIISNTSTSLPLNTWTHLVITRDTTNTRLYVNGIEKYSLSNTPNNPSGIFVLGSNNSGSENFTGKIDEVLFYSRKISQKEIVALFTHKQPKLATGGTISDNLIVTGNVSVTEPINFSSISQPSSPNAGQVYSDGNGLKFYDGSSWVDLTAAGNTAWTQPGSGNLLYNNGSVTMGSITDQQGTLIVGNGGSSDNILTLDDNGASVFTVADGGSVGIGTTSPSQKVDVVGTAGFGATSVGGNITISDNIMPSANITYDIGTNAASLNTAYSTDYVLLSDKRLKAGVKEADHALERISNLRPVQFQFKDTPHLTRLGLIAQEVEDVVPEAVSTGTGPQGIKAVSYHELTVLLLAAQKEEMNEIDSQFEKLHERLQRIQAERGKLMQVIKKKVK